MGGAQPPSPSGQDNAPRELSLEDEDDAIVVRLALIEDVQYRLQLDRTELRDDFRYIESVFQQLDTNFAPSMLFPAFIRPADIYQRMQRRG